MAENPFTSEQLLKYAERYGVRARRTLSVLGKNQQLVNALNNPIGIEFLRILITRMENNRINYDTLDIDSSNAKFIEARAKYKESESILFSFLDIFENQDVLIKQVKEDLKNK